jgi:alpha-L-fucosidase
MHFNEVKKINCIVLREEIKNGQSVEEFSVRMDGNKRIEGHTTTIGRKRIITFPEVSTDHLYIYFSNSKRKVMIAGIAAYLIDESLIEQ